jgi:hypothetical protein
MANSVTSSNTLQLKHQLPGQVNPFSACVFNPKHQHVLTSDSMSLRLWSCQKELRRQTLHKGAHVEGLHYSSRFDFYLCCGSDFEGPKDGAVVKIFHPSLALLAQFNAGNSSDFGDECQIVGSAFLDEISSLFIASLPIRDSVIGFRNARRNKNHALQRDSRLQVGSFKPTGPDGEDLTLEVLQWVVTGSTNARGSIDSTLIRKYEITLPTHMGECSANSVCCWHVGTLMSPSSADGSHFLFCAIGSFVGCWRISDDQQARSDPESSLEKGWWIVKNEIIADTTSVIACLSYNRDMETLVVGYKDGSLELWKLPLSTLLEQYQALVEKASVSTEIGLSSVQIVFGAHEGGVNHIAQAPEVDPNGFMTCGEDGFVRHWTCYGSGGPCEQVGFFSQKIMAPKREYGDTDNFMPIPRFVIPALFFTTYAQHHLLLALSAGSICILNSISPNIQKTIARTEDDILSICCTVKDLHQPTDDILVLSKRNKLQVFTLSDGDSAISSRTVPTAARRSVGVVQKAGVEKQKGRVTKKHSDSSRAHAGRTVTPGQIGLNCYINTKSNIHLNVYRCMSSFLFWTFVFGLLCSRTSSFTEVKSTSCDGCSRFGWNETVASSAGPGRQ